MHAKTFRLRYLLPVAAAAALMACSKDEPAPKAKAPAAPAPAQLPAGKVESPAKPKTEIKDSDYKGPGPLTAFADADETVGEVPLTVKLNVDVVDNTGNPPFKYTWDFGDATEFSTEKSPSHVYKIPGSFRASVIITDSKGEVDQDYVDLSVNEDVEYVITPEQLREALPPEELMKKAREAQEKARGGAPAPGGAPAQGGAHAPGGAPPPGKAQP